ncbi:flagellar motor protein MotB [Vogesella indigofera]|uniref:flagellar motor protein MotB n=1 Tax=Vogesella indigofera TaxID=45465 RepID=UPI003F41C3AE
MADESQRPIIVKRIKKGHGGHHGGAWKIAYADFVTAMMAFFLLMWLLGSTSAGALSGISQYFQMPLKLALQGGEGAGDATAVIPGGGTDLTRQSGQVKRGNPDPTSGQKRAELSKLQQRIQQKLQQKMEQSAVLKSFKDQVKLEMTPEGLRIQLIDEQNRPMFQSGGALPMEHTRVLLQEIGRELNEVTNKISISGHTDATRFAGAATGYTNWELSADRANAARRELIAGGMLDEKVLRVVGLASADPLNKQNVFSSENRRIAIVILNEETESQIRGQGPVAEAAPVAAAVAGAPAAP